MRITAIMLFGMFAASSIDASAQPPAWFIAKHPEVKQMEKRQEQLAAKESARKKLASRHGKSHHTTSSQSGKETQGS